VILLDLQMPIMDGYQAVRQIKNLCPSCGVVDLTM
jgi:CheY-like chemotaxis protein